MSLFGASHISDGLVFTYILELNKSYNVEPLDFSDICIFRVLQFNGSYVTLRQMLSLRKRCNTNQQPSY